MGGIAGHAHPVGDYAKQAEGATDLPALKEMANYFKTILDTEPKTMQYLRQEAVEWPRAGERIQQGGDTFLRTARDVKSLWIDAQGTAYMAAATVSANSISRSAEAITGSTAGGPSGGGKTDLAGQVDVLSNNLDTIRTSVATVITSIGNAIGAEMMSGGEAVTGVKMDLTPLQGALKQVGAQMDLLANQYLAFGQQVVTMANGIKWEGADDGGASAAGPKKDPSNRTAAPSATAPQSAPPGGTPPDTGGEGAPEAGGEGAPEGGAAGGETPGGGDPGLSGMPPIDTPQVPGISNLPPSTIPKPHVTPITPIPPLGAFQKSPVGGGKGGGGLGLGGLGGAKAGGGLGGAKVGGLKGIDSLPVAAKGIGEGSAGVTTGRAPTLNGQTSAGGSAGGAAGGGSPMMPPMSGAGAGGGGGGGKPGNGSTKPNGRQRQRAGGPTPGVPDRLRGKAGQRGGPAPAVVGKRRRTEAAAQILDEELWAVENGTIEAPAAEPQRVYRPAN
ncbi:hypothetical protein E1263_06205 [Kribbella antibiotica]|uniref:Uncharacterized protein n=1 Tax=Kribbella antibiotica TaxID=190195 RepID=A0A4R4ZX66_9ACTN|nr:hypothetical protein [Kribbella antibiotica]TDD61782.1 hypothetical protein E1263_06205 [Kribbella antibiotica]